MQSDRKLAFELQKVISQLKRAITLKGDYSKLKGAEKHILFLICELTNGQPVTISKLANKIGITLAAVTHQINTLEKQGLIKRLSDHNDRRSVIIKLTKKGDIQVINLKKEFTKRTQILTEFLGANDTKNLMRQHKSPDSVWRCSGSPDDPSDIL